MIKIPIEDIDIIFISYDEPLKEQFWAELQDMYPFAKRVDGVTGFDAAHKEAARQAETDRFITIDGDTKVEPSFFDMELCFDEKYRGHVFSWASRNDVNGLVYGNGSLKCWPTKAALNMKTHEASSDAVSSVEFCWSLPYLSMKDSFSTTYPGATPYHAFRAGFREGVKMALDRGQRIPPDKLFETIWEGNAIRLMIWSSMGADHENGLWSIYGARLGLDMLNKKTLDHEMIADYNWFPELWNDIKTQCEGDKIICKHSGWSWNEEYVLLEINQLGREIYKYTGKDIPLFEAHASRILKEINNFHEPSTEHIIYPLGKAPY